MNDPRDSLETFDPKEIEEITKKCRESGLKEIKGNLKFSVGHTFSILEVTTTQGLVEGEWSENQPPGFFLLFSRGDLARLVKRAFDLQEKSQ